MFLGKGFMFTSFKYGNRFMHARKSQIWLDKFDGTPGFLKAAGFSIVKGLSGKGISFQMGNLYLSVAGGQINLAAGGSAAFKKSATFMVRFGLGAGRAGFGISFESVAMPGYYITESKYRVVIAKMVNSASWKSDATWKAVKAQVTHQTITKTVTKTTTTHINCGFQCAMGAMQKVKSIGTSKEADRKKCSMKCCMTKGCAAFDYDSKSKVCALSAASFAKAHPVQGGKTMMTCQKAASGDEPQVTLDELDDEPEEDEQIEQIKDEEQPEVESDAVVEVLAEDE